MDNKLYLKSILDINENSTINNQICLFLRENHYTTHLLNNDKPNMAKFNNELSKCLIFWKGSNLVIYEKGMYIKLDNINDKFTSYFEINAENINGTLEIIHNDCQYKVVININNNTLTVKTNNNGLVNITTYNLNSHIINPNSLLSITNFMEKQITNIFKDELLIKKYLKQTKNR